MCRPRSCAAGERRGRNIPTWLASFPTNACRFHCNNVGNPLSSDQLQTGSWTEEIQGHERGASRHPDRHPAARRGLLHDERRLGDRAAALAQPADRPGGLALAAGEPRWQRPGRLEWHPDPDGASRYRSARLALFPCLRRAAHPVRRRAALSCHPAQGGAKRRARRLPLHRDLSAGARRLARWLSLDDPLGEPSRLPGGVPRGSSAPTSSTRSTATG